MVVANVRLPLGCEAFHFRVQRPHRVLPQHFERDALTQVAEGTAVHQQRFLWMRQHVDEARRHRLAVRINPFALPTRARAVRRKRGDRL